MRWLAVKRFISLIFIITILATLLTGCSDKEVSVIEETKTQNSNIDIPENENIGERIEIDVYVNNIKSDTPVYKNKTSNDPKNLSDYVLLDSVCDTMGAAYILNEDSITLQYNNEEFIITRISFSENRYWIIDDSILIQFSSIRYAIHGGLKQDDEKSMYLYTADFERLDIPGTLEECYAALDEMLDDETKNDIKESSDNLINYHFGLGTWIRNNWIYPTDGRIAKVFFDAGYEHVDAISGAILTGYHYYLNNLPYDIK